MRGKVAKAMRRVAEQATVGSPDVRYKGDPNTRARALVPGCTRFTYHEMKRIRVRGL